MEKNKAFVYARLSQQGETEESITRQIELGSAYAQSHRWEAELYIEPAGYRSGYYEHQRPAWQQLKKDIAARDDVAAVVVADFARASRKVEHFFSFVEFLQQRNIQFVSLKEQVDAATAAGRALLGMIAVFNQFYRDDVSERKKRQFRYRDPNIYAPNTAPIGLKRTGKYPNVTWEPTEDFKFVVEALTLYAEGLSASQVAIDMRGKGHTWQSPNAKFRTPAPQEMTIRNLVNKVERYANQIDPLLLHRVQMERERRGRRRANSKNAKHPLPYLRQLLYCEACGARYFSHWRVGQRGNDTSIYDHPPAQCARAFKTIRAPTLHKQFWDKFRWLDLLSEADLDAIAHRIFSNVQRQDPQPEDSNLRRAKLVSRLSGYEEMRADGDISRERFLQLKEELEHDIAEIDKVTQDGKARVRVEHLSEAAIRGQLQDLRSIINTQNPAHWQKTNVFLHSIISRIVMLGDELQRIEYNKGWEWLSSAMSVLET